VFAISDVFSRLGVGNQEAFQDEGRGFRHEMFAPQFCHGHCRQTLALNEFFINKIKLRQVQIFRQKQSANSRQIVGGYGTASALIFMERGIYVHARTSNCNCVFFAAFGAHSL
jgi:hypothetical protein